MNLTSFYFKTVPLPNLDTMEGENNMDPKLPG